MVDSTNNSSATLWTQNGTMELQNGNLADDQEGGQCIMSLNTVIITNMSGETLCNVSINSNCTVRGLKEVIEHTIGVPSVEQHLTFAEFTLDEENASVMQLAIDGAPFVVAMTVRLTEGHDVKLILSSLFTILKQFIEARMSQEPIDN